MYTYKEPLIFVLSGKAKSGKNLLAEKIIIKIKDVFKYHMLFILKIMLKIYTVGVEVKKINQENYFKKSV